MINIVTQTCPNQTGVSVIDNSDRFEDALKLHCIQQVVESFFAHQIAKVCPHKIVQNGLSSFW